MWSRVWLAKGTRWLLLSGSLGGDVRCWPSDGGGDVQAFHAEDCVWGR